MTSIVAEILSSHRVSKMRILQIRLVLFTHLSPYPFCFLLAYPTLQFFLVPTSILPDIVEPPSADQDELQS